MFDFHSRARRSTLGALVFVAATTMTACAHSQQAPPADSAAPRAGGDWHGPQMGHRGDHRGDRMLEGLNLTTEQHDQIKAIRERYHARADSLRAGGMQHDSTSRAAFRSMMMQQMQEIRGVLTPDQQKQFDDRIAKMRERREQNGGRGDRDHSDGHDAPAPPDNSGGTPAPPAA
jgi:protein CpxP